MNLELSDRFYYRAVMITLIAYLIAYLWTNYQFILWDISDPDSAFIDLMEPGLCVLSILTLFLLRKKTLKPLMIVLGIMLSVLSLFNSYLILVEYAPVVDYSVFNFIEGTLELFVGVFLIINILMFVANLSNDMTMMLCAAAGLLFINITNMLTPVRFDMGFEYTLQVFSTRIPMSILLILMIMISKSKSVSSGTNLYVIKTSFQDIRSTGVPIGVIMLRSDLRTITDAVNGNTWEHDSEFHLKSSYSNEYRFVFAKRDSKIYAALSSLNDTTSIDSHRFILRGIDPDTGDIGTCDTVRFYSEDGFFIQIIVVDAFPEPPENPFKKLLRFKGRNGSEDSEKTENTAE